MQPALKGRSWKPLQEEIRSVFFQLRVSCSCLMLISVIDVIGSIYDESSKKSDGDEGTANDDPIVP